MLTRRNVLGSLGTILAFRAFGAFPAARREPRSFARDATELLAAVQRGDLERVRGLLATDAGLARAQDERGRSAYVLAHVHGHPEIAALLRSAGLELDLVESTLAEDWERVEALGKAQPELIERAHPIGGTPLYAAALVGSLELWRLRKLGCSPDATPEGGSGFTPARGAMESPRASWARIALSDLCGNGADVNARQRAGSSVLHGAVLRRDETLMRLAIRKGAEVEALDGEGRTARDLAVELGWDSGAKLLAEHRSLPRDNRASRFALDARREPVVRADLSDVPRELQAQVTGSSHGNLKKVRELVESDPRLVFSISTDDELAIEACAHTGAREIIRFHLDHGAPLSLPTAVSLGDLETVAFWLERDSTLVHERGAHDFPLMWYAVIGGDSLEAAELLLQHGTPVDQETVGTTALHWCASRGALDLASFLIENGADPEAVGYKWSKDGETPLQLAVANGEAKMAALLKEAGAKR